MCFSIENNVFLKKTTKASLLHKLEGTTEPVTTIDDDCAFIGDGMAYIQQARMVDLTFGQLAQNLMQTVLLAGRSAKRIDVVFETYRGYSESPWDGTGLSDKQLPVATYYYVIDLADGGACGDGEGSFVELLR